MKKGYAGSQRRLVWERDNYTCQYCFRNMLEGYQAWQRGEIKRKDALLTVDHIIPKSKGGSWELDNLVTACSICNRKKGNKLLGDEIYRRASEEGEGSTPSKHTRLPRRKKGKGKVSHTSRKDTIVNDIS